MTRVGRGCLTARRVLSPRLRRDGLRQMRVGVVDVEREDRMDLRSSVSLRNLANLKCLPDTGTRAWRKEGRDDQQGSDGSGAGTGARWLRQCLADVRRARGGKPTPSTAPVGHVPGLWCREKAG